jgi:hypothetical protein
MRLKDRLNEVLSPALINIAKSHVILDGEIMSPKVPVFIRSLIASKRISTKFTVKSSLKLAGLICYFLV